MKRRYEHFVERMRKVCRSTPILGMLVGFATTIYVTLTSNICKTVNSCKCLCLYDHYKDIASMFKGGKSPECFRRPIEIGCRFNHRIAFVARIKVNCNNTFDTEGKDALHIP